MIFSLELHIFLNRKDFFQLLVVICEDTENEQIFRGDKMCTFANFKYMFLKLTISLTFLNPVMLTNLFFFIKVI